MLLGKKINITINQNVEKVFSSISLLKEKIKNKDYDFEHIINNDRGSNWKNGYDGASYAWGVKADRENKEREGYAHMVVIHEHSEDGVWLYGKIIESICPWAHKLKDLCRGLDLVEIGVMQHSGDVIPHVDYSTNDPGEMSRLVTVLYQEDPTAHLISWRADKELVEELRESAVSRQTIDHEKFHLKPGESYILNIKKAHAVYNSKKRLILTARFNNSVEEVSDHFERLGPTTLG